MLGTEVGVAMMSGAVAALACRNMRLCLLPLG